MHNMVNFGLLAAEIVSGFGAPQLYFQRLPRLGSVTARQSSSERQSNFAALNRGRHLCSAERPSRWALAHISSYDGLLSEMCQPSYQLGMICCNRTICKVMINHLSVNADDMLLTSTAVQWLSIIVCV